QHDPRTDGVGGPCFRTRRLVVLSVRCADHRDLPAFPTRRSSDLELYLGLQAEWLGGHGGATRDDVAGRHGELAVRDDIGRGRAGDRKSTRLNSSHGSISYAVLCLNKKHRHAAEIPPQIVPTNTNG